MDAEDVILYDLLFCIQREYVSCEPTESARKLFAEDCEPVEEKQ